MTTSALQVTAWVRTNEYYRTAIDCPEYAEAVELREKALAMHGELRPPQSPRMPGAGDDLTAWLEAVAATDTAERARAAQLSAITSLINQCNSTIASLAMVDPDRLLRSLTKDMDDLMSDVDAVVERLGQARTPREVIAAGVGDAWNELGTLREAYDKLCQAQEFVMTGKHRWIASRSNYLDDPHASDTHIANLDNMFPDLRDKSSRLIMISGEEPDPRPWPLDPIEQLVWFSSSDAQVWIPTRRQLDQLHADRQRRRNPMPAKKPKSKYPRQIHGETVQRAPWCS